MVSFINTSRILHGKCARTVFTHELLTFKRSPLFAALTRSISDTRTTSACGIVFIIYILRHSSFCQLLISILSQMLK